MGEKTQKVCSHGKIHGSDYRKISSVTIGFSLNQTRFVQKTASPELNEGFA